jgi:N-methylhydantoinase B/oxoprolinase/acetone carboxylase alpha subunit
METIVGFVAGYLVGTREGRDGLERLRTSWNAIRTSPEVRKLAADAVSMAEMAVRSSSGGRGLSLGGAVGNVTDMLVRRAVAAREGARAA